MDAATGATDAGMSPPGGDAGTDAGGAVECTRVLWDSAAWGNGNPREFGDGFDPDDDQVEVRAGECRNFVVDGEGTATLEGMRSRIYIHGNHRNAILTFEANAADDRLTNISVKVRSRHNEGGDPEDRFGGYGVAFNFDEPSVSFKIESYHNEHESGTDHDLAEPLQYGRWYGFRVRIEAREDDTIARVTAFVDYDLSGAWTEVGREDYERTGYRLNDVNALYSWIRANGDECQDGLALRNARFEELCSD